MGREIFRILYVGPLWYGSTCLQRMEAFKFLGHSILSIDTTLNREQCRVKQLIEQLTVKICGPRDLVQANINIRKLIKENEFDILWIDKGLTILPETISQVKESIPSIVVVSYSPDDMMNPNNQSKSYLRSIPLYDLHVTTKSYNVTELKELGAKKVFFIDNAFCPSIHRPTEVSEKERIILGGKVGFIGTFEKERAKFITFLAENGVKIKVWGEWPNYYKNKLENLEIMGGPLWGIDYAKAICSFDINLCFLRKINRDLQTTRSIEIPACGGFMLAERTDEHMKLFKDGKEVEFYESREELLEKVLYYLSHDEERRKIAEAGLNRCLKSCYSNQDRLGQVLLYIKEHFSP